MKLITILALLLTVGCTSTIKRVTSSGYTEPPIVAQPDVIEPISASTEKNVPADLAQANDVFMNLVLLVVIICVLSVTPLMITYLKAKWGRCPNDQDNE